MFRRPPRSPLFPYPTLSRSLAVGAGFLVRAGGGEPVVAAGVIDENYIRRRQREEVIGDRKSTRLNSSHSQISYAVFCLKKKRNYRKTARTTVRRGMYSHLLA